MNALRRAFSYVFLAIVFAASTPSLAIQAPQIPARFSRLTLNDPSMTVPVLAVSVDLLPPDDPLRTAWKEFVADHGGAWHVYLDGRSAAPLLVEGQGIPWIAGSGNSLAETSLATLESLEQSLRSF